MYDDAIAWAEAELGWPVERADQLTGGMTSTMLVLSGAAGQRAVLRLMTNEPWRTHGEALTRRERDAQRVLAAAPVPAPLTIALDADADLAAHLMTHLPGTPATTLDEAAITAMARMLADIHEVQPDVAFRTYESWAWEAKWVVPEWTRHQTSWQTAFDLLAGEPPPYDPVFLHRDFSHRNLLWDHGRISGVVDWVETSTGPAWLDVGHAATNLAVASGRRPARALLESYAQITERELDQYWLVLDAVGFLPPPGKRPMFGAAEELERLDAWLHELVGRVQRCD